MNPTTNEFEGVNRGAGSAPDEPDMAAQAHCIAAEAPEAAPYRRPARHGRDPRIVWPGFGMSMLWLAAGFAALGGAVWSS